MMDNHNRTWLALTTKEQGVDVQCFQFLPRPCFPSPGVFIHSFHHSKTFCMPFAMQGPEDPTESKHRNTPYFEKLTLITRDRH